MPAGERGQAQGHAAGAAGGHAQLKRPFQLRPGFRQPALLDGQDGLLHPGEGRQPGVVEPLGQVLRRAQVAERVVVAANDRLQGTGGGDGQDHPKRFFLAWNSSRETDACRRAPSKSPRIGEVHAIAMFDAACR